MICYRLLLCYVSGSPEGRFVSHLDAEVRRARVPTLFTNHMKNNRGPWAHVQRQRLNITWVRNNSNRPNQFRMAIHRDRDSRICPIGSVLSDSSHD